MKCLIFDLDDTLMDTTQILVPQAAFKSCKVMIQEGLKTTLEECLLMRSKFLENSNYPDDVYNYLIHFFGIKNPQRAEFVSQRGEATFRRPDLKDLKLFEGVQEMLENCRRHFSLYLVTLGVPEIQRRKVEILKIDSYFEKIYYLNYENEIKKSEAFIEIRKRENIKYEDILCIGDRWDQEIYEAKDLGIQSCWVDRNKNKNENLNVTYHIQHIRELMNIVK